MLKQVASALLFVTISGCACVDLTQSERMSISAMRGKGIAWSRERNKGTFVPPITMGSAVGWGILPGAGQIFIADKIKDAGLEDRFNGSRTRLQSSGAVMLLFSWIPYVYDFTLPFGIGGIIQDVNRINNYALLKHLEAQEQSKEK